MRGPPPRGSWRFRALDRRAPQAALRRVDSSATLGWPELFNGRVLIRPVRHGEAAALTALALRSKAHWGYDDAFMARVATELKWDDDELAGMLVDVADHDGELVGFSAVNLQLDPPELEALFVEPEHIGTGMGRALLERACEAARSHGVPELEIDADPDAEAFYLSQGARRIGGAESPSTGRILPRMVISTKRR